MVDPKTSSLVCGLRVQCRDRYPKAIDCSDIHPTSGMLRQGVKLEPRKRHQARSWMSERRERSTAGCSAGETFVAQVITFCGWLQALSMYDV